VKRILVINALICAVLAGASCSEDLDGGGTCPALCPEQTLPVRDTILNAIEFDTTVGPFPLIGTEAGLLLASRSDSLDVRAVVRFDTLAKTFALDGADQEITAVDSARIFIRVDTSVVNFTGTIRLEAYDVDTTAADTNTAAVAALFRPDRLLGSIEVLRAQFFLDDTLSIAIPNSFLLGRIRGGGHVRIGLRMVGEGDLTISSIEQGLPMTLRFDPAPGNTAVLSRTQPPLSNTPSGEFLLANDLRDYSLVVKGMPPPTERLAAGGLPAYRSYLRFNIPKKFLDSVTIVRAQLILVQRPIRGLDDDSLAVVFPAPVSTTPLITDIRRAAQLIYPEFSFGLAGLALAPSDSGERRLELVGLIRQWSLTSKIANAPATALVLRGSDEGRSTGRLAFFGLDAAPDLRPRLRLSYVERSRFGIP
jgi:hypothetical protein